MAKLSGEAITTVNQLSIDDNARADTCAKRDFYEVLHAASGTVSHLAHSGCVSVIGKGYGDAKPVGEHLCQRHDAIMTPLQVGGKLDGASIVVAIRRADTHRLDFIYAANLVDNHLKGLYASVHIVLNLIIYLSLHGRGDLDVSARVDNAKH